MLIGTDTRYVYKIVGTFQRHVLVNNNKKRSEISCKQALPPISTLEIRRVQNLKSPLALPATSLKEGLSGVKAFSVNGIFWNFYG